MVIHEIVTPVHWNYLLALEEDISHLSRYLEPTQKNFKSYSLELARILFAAASEVDVVAKLICKKINSQSKAENINNYRKEITAAFPKFHETKILIPRFGLTLEPWINWKGKTRPLWWWAYNKVKHERNIHFSEANLQNTLNSVAGLFIIILYYQHQRGQLDS